jgi:TonB-linked SusC/RagA family outer membrane protein
MKKGILHLFMIILLFVCTGSVFAQTQIRGVVKNNGGESLPGTTVLEKGTANGTITDVNGNYVINVSGSESVLVFSFIGTESKEFLVGNQENIDVILILSNVGLNEVVVTALGITREKKSLGYGIEEVSGDDLNNTPQDNVLNSLSGKVAGVKISQMGGLAGSSVNMTIRGTTSLNSDNQPLFVIDGVPVSNSLNNFYQGADMGNSISDINTDDIESVSVLKGPSAAALYGSRAGNGVVLITTKSGSSSKHGIGVDLNSAVTMDTPMKYIEYQTEFGPGKAGVHMFEEAQNESWGPRLDAGESAVQWDSDGIAAPLLSYDNRQTDFYQTGITYTNNISVNGNYKEGGFRISVGDVRNTGIVPNTDFNRKSISLNGTYNVTPKLKVQGNIGVTESGSDNRIVVDGGREDVVRSVYEMSAHVNILDLKDYWQPGQENIQQLKYKHKQNNPWFVVNENLIGFQRDRTVSKIQFDWDITNDLTLTGRYSRDSYSEGREAKTAFSTYGQWEGGYNTQSVYRKESNLDMMLNYDKTINEIWDVNALVGGNNMNMYGRSLSNEAKSLVVPNIYSVSNGLPGTVLYNSSWYEKTMYSIYGMASVGYNQMIYLDLTARNDWSSTLPKENRSYFYPSASLSVLVSEMVDLPQWLTFAKLRGGIAQVGNDVGPYQLQQYFSTAEDWGEAKRMYMGGTLKNTSLKPEIATSKEIGVDLKFLNNRLGLEATYYVVENKNQVLSIGLPVESGATSKQINAGLIESRGWEIGITSTPIIAGKFKWDLNVSISRDRTKIMELADGIEYFQFGSVGTAIVRTYVGETIGDIYMKPLLTVEDESSPYNGYPLLNNGGQYQKNNDPNSVVKIGNSNHDFIMGIQPTFRYKSFSLFANIDWRQGGEFFSRTMTFFSNNGQLDNTFSGVSYDSNRNIEEQIKENPDAFFGNWIGGRTAEYGGFVWPDASNGRDQDACFHAGVREVTDSDGNKTYIENIGGDGTVWLTPFTANKKVVRNLADKNMYSATYVKLRELALTYSLPETLVQKMKMQDVSVSFVAKNILEWTAAGINFDPERAFKGGSAWVQGVEYYNALPLVGSLGFKLNVKF